MIKKIKSLKNHQSFMKYFKNTSWLFFERIFKMGIGFFIIILLTRYLGPENYGLLSYSQSFVGMFIAFSTLGLEVILVRELTKRKSETNIILGTALVLKFIASFISFFVVITLNFFIAGEETIFLTNIIAFTLLFYSLNLGMDTYFQANVLSKYAVVSNTTVYIITSILKFLLIYYKADLIYFAYILVFDAVFTFIGYMYIYELQNRSILSLKFNKTMAIYFIKSGWTMMMVSMAVFFYTKIDQIMIKHLLDNISVGYYSAAIRVSELFYFIPSLVAQSVFPKIIEEHNKGNEKNYFKLLLTVYKITLWISIPIVIFVSIFNEWIIEILFGPAFLASASILSVLTFCLIFVSVGSINTKILYVENYENKYLKRSVLGVLINIGLNFIFITIYGAVGAAVATLITLFVIHYIYDLFDKDLWKFYHLKLACFIPRLK